MSKAAVRRRSLRPTKPTDFDDAPRVPIAARKRRIVMVDLNNFATFPTYAIGLIVAALREAGHEVKVISPLAHDVPAVQREHRETYLDHVQRRIHLSTLPAFRSLKQGLRLARLWSKERPHPVVLREVARALDERPDILLLSAYLQHFPSVREIGRLAAQRGVPVLLGGGMFNVAGVAEAWRDLPGLTAIVGAEVDLSIPAIVEAVCGGGDVGAYPGVTLPDGSRSQAAAPLRKLDRAPMADFSDFPWERYPVRIVPLMTGRGCQWDKCLFCSDVISVSGRTFRTRSVENVLSEMEEQAHRHKTAYFLFLDLKLNSYPDMIRGVAAGLRSRVPGAEWVGTVHVDTRADNGLSREDLRLAVEGGMRRVSFGLESGSQRLLDLMKKGSNVERNAEFIRHGHEAGLSMRCSMFKGFPGETAEDMEATAAFLEAHAPYLDRVRFNDFTLLEDTPIYRTMLAREDGPLRVTRILARKARAEYRNEGEGGRAYRRAKARVLGAVHAINRRPLRDSARHFDGLM